MRRERTSKSGRRIIITSPDDAAPRAAGDSPVACCLLTAWDAWPRPKAQTVKLAVDSDCRYFMCAGSRARELHDALDESIESAALEGGSETDAEALAATAWFEGNANETVDVFLQSGDPKLSIRQDAVWLAILDETCPEDSPIVEALLEVTDEVR